MSIRRKDIEENRCIKGPCCMQDVQESINSLVKDFGGWWSTSGEADCDIGMVGSSNCRGDIDGILAVTRPGSRFPDECACLIGENSDTWGIVEVHAL